MSIRKGMTEKIDRVAAERKIGQQDKETANAEMLNPNLYPGGLRHKERPKTLGLKFPWVSKKSILKKDKKTRRARAVPIHFVCIIVIICMCTVCMCVVMWAYVCVHYSAIHRNKRHSGLKTDTLADPSVPAS